MRSRTIAAIAMIAVLGGLIAVWVAHTETPVLAGAVSIDQLPIDVMTTAKHELPSCKFAKAWRLKNGNYQLQGRDPNGKIREVEVDSQGKIDHIE